MASSATATACYLDEIARPAGDPLPGRAGGPRRDRPGQPARPAGDRGRPARSLGRLTVPRPLAGGLLGIAARRDYPEATTPAFSEQANQTARLLVRPQAGPGGTSPGFRMSLVSWNLHYIRDGEGGEELYDMLKDPLENRNLITSEEHVPVLGALRTMLLDVLNESPGSTAVEQTYLQSYRRSLESQVRDRDTGPVAIDHRGGSGSRRSIPSAEILNSLVNGEGLRSTGLMGWLGGPPGGWRRDVDRAGAGGQHPRPSGRLTPPAPVLRSRSSRIAGYRTP